jgi:hypothetical protein
MLTKKGLTLEELSEETDSAPEMIPDTDGDSAFNTPSPSEGSESDAAMEVDSEVDWDAMVGISPITLTTLITLMNLKTLMTLITLITLIPLTTLTTLII